MSADSSNIAEENNFITMTVIIAIIRVNVIHNKKMTVSSTLSSESVFHNEKDMLGGTSMKNRAALPF